MTNLRAPSPTWAAAMIAAAEQAGEAGDRDLHFALLWLVATRAHWADPGPAARRTLVEAASRLGDADDLHVLAIQAYADPFGHAPAVLAHVQRAAAEGGNDTEALLYLGNAAVAVGAFDVADTLLSAGTQALRADGRLGHLAYVLSVQGIVTTRLAKWDVAIPAAAEATRLSTELGQPLWKAAADTIVAAIAGMRGDADAAEQAAADAERIALPIGANMIVALAQFGRVSAALGASRHDDAYEAADAPLRPHRPGPSSCDGLVDHRRPCRGRPPRWPHRGGTSARGADRSRRRQEPDDLDRAGFAARPRTARRRRAGRPNASRRHWAPTSAAGPSSAPEPCSLTAGGSAASVVSPSRAHRCARPVTRSTRSAAPRSANRHAASCAHQGSRAGAATPPPATSSRAQELQIAHLAAEGLSNREIGQQLYLSHRTIGTHLYRIFPKLGITTRSELGPALSAGASPPQR